MYEDILKIRPLHIISHVSVSVIGHLRDDVG